MQKYLSIIYLFFYFQILLFPGLQPFNLCTPSYQQNGNDAFLCKKSVARSLLLYATGNSHHLSSCMKNKHVGSDVFSKLNRTHLDIAQLSDNLKYPPYKPSAAVKADEKVWKAIQSVFMNPLLSPLITDDLTGLPSAYIVTAQHDVLRDDGFLYARRLQQAGVKVTHDHLDNGFHDAGFHIGLSFEEKIPELKSMRQLQFAGISRILSP